MADLSPITVTIPWNGECTIEPLSFHRNDRMTRMDFVYNRKKYMYHHLHTRTQNAITLTESNGFLHYDQKGMHAAFGVFLKEAATRAVDQLIKRNSR